MKTKLALIAVVVAQVVFLLAWAGYHEFVLQTAPVVKIKVRPVDPRDLLRGDYMILRYDISEHAAPAGWVGPTAEVWVGLRDVEGIHRIDEISPASERPRDDARLWVHATAEGSAPSGGEATMVTLTYGIEHFFVPEGRGTPRFDRLEVEASVSPLGRLQLKRVWLDGEIFP
jgi:uncharacterized membrane-anchored protein